MAATRGPAAIAAVALLLAGAPPGDATQGGAQLASRGTVVDYPPGRVARLPEVRASAFVVADAGTGQVLAARDPHGWYRPASTLKVLTAISLIPVLNPDSTTVASRMAADTEPNDVGLVAGQRYKIADLFRALLTISANDAAVALAQATGSFARGLDLMNAEAHELQADDTVAREPNGLDAAGQHTSAYDEALIARRALSVPAFLGYDRTLTARFERKPRRWVTLVNQNLMLTGYPGDIGGKIGWTSRAGATYVGMARRHGETLIVTLLHCPPLTEFSTATRLFDWGFAADGKIKPAGTLVPPLPPGSAKKPQPRRTVAAATRARSTAAASGTPVGPIAGGASAFLLIVLAATGLALRRKRNAADTTQPPRPSAPPG